MAPLEAALLFLALFVPCSWLVHRHFRLLSDPRYLRSQGVVIVVDGVLEARSASIGEYRGCPIWASVTFMGMPYRFDRIIDPRRREAIGPGELYLDPGLVYVAQ